MKNFIFIYLLFLPALLIAQSKKFEISSKTGINLSKINNDKKVFIPAGYGAYVSINDMESGFKTGFVSGFEVKYFITNRMGLVSGLYYSSKGFLFDYSKTVEIFNNVYTKIDYYMNTKIEYLEIPLSVQYSFGNKIKFIPSAGLYLNLLLDQYSETKPYIMPDDMESGSTELELSKTIIGLKLGGNLSYSISENINLLIDIEYNNDFSKVFDYDDNELNTVNTDDGTYEVTQFGVNAESKLRSLTLMAGLTFMLF